MRVLARIFLVLILLVSLGCGDDSSLDEKSCEEIKQMIDDELDALNYCSDDGECVTITLLTCYWAAINASASANKEKLNELEEEFIEKECSILCPLSVPTGAYCEEGKCKLTDY
ncbi:MAG: hypothetical protein JSU92_10490 [Deltaproteobacteria bacterium]|nr:MAG: hypothetical protein JSU92_10490 [Deltaproteobacteria bacterium]